MCKCRLSIAVSSQMPLHERDVLKVPGLTVTVSLTAARFCSWVALQSVPALACVVRLRLLPAARHAQGQNRYTIALATLNADSNACMISLTIKPSPDVPCLHTCTLASQHLKHSLPTPIWWHARLWTAWTAYAYACPDRRLLPLDPPCPQLPRHDHRLQHPSDMFIRPM